MPRLTAADEFLYHPIPERLPKVVILHDHWRESLFVVAHHPYEPGDVFALVRAHLPRREATGFAPAWAD